MENSAITKAVRKFNRAYTAFLDLQKCDNYESFESIWSDFLIATNSVYTVLGKGARTNATSRQWYGGKKAFRKRDPLLQYLHQARNSEEHGLEQVTKHQGSQFAILTGHGYSNHLHIKHLFVHSGGVYADVASLDKKPVKMSFSGPRAILVRVHDDRYGDHFDPPKRHEEKLIDGTNPLTVANFALSYLDRLLEEAKRLS